MERKPALILAEKEKTLIRMIRDLNYGEVRIFVTNSQPVRVEEIKRSVKL